MPFCQYLEHISIKTPYIRGKQFKEITEIPIVHSSKNVYSHKQSEVSRLKHGELLLLLQIHIERKRVGCCPRIPFCGISSLFFLVYNIYSHTRSRLADRLNYTFQTFTTQCNFIFLSNLSFCTCRYFSYW